MSIDRPVFTEIINKETHDYILKIVNSISRDMTILLKRR